VSRFDRDTIGIEGLSASLDSATEEIRATVERQLREIVAMAEQKAAQIEERALENAAQTERESMRKRDEMFETGVNRAYRMLEAIDALEAGIAAVIGTIRNEGENLTAELEAVRTAASSSPGPAAEAEASTVESGEMLESDEIPAESHAAAIDEGAPEPVIDKGSPEYDLPTRESFPDTQAGDEPGPGVGNPEVRDMVRLQLVTLFQSGKPRVDAERFLRRFRDGDRFRDLLEEIYDQEEEPGPSASRRRRIRRRRAKQQAQQQNDED
jgi:hypothetical protein